MVWPSNDSLFVNKKRRWKKSKSKNLERFGNCYTTFFTNTKNRIVDRRLWSPHISFPSCCHCNSMGMGCWNLSRKNWSKRINWYKKNPHLCKKNMISFFLFIRNKNEKRRKKLTWLTITFDGNWIRISGSWEILMIATSLLNQFCISFKGSASLKKCSFVCWEIA